jgi:hypothetical protein
MMRTDRLAVLALVAASSLAAGSAAATQKHVVSTETARATLVQADAQRGADLTKLDALLSCPAAVAASRKGVAVAVARQALPTLSSTELRDLASRVQALDRDPASGLSKDANDLLVIFLVVAIVILVLKAV